VEERFEALLKKGDGDYSEEKQEAAPEREDEEPNND
jgi:hypothetical protein